MMNPGLFGGAPMMMPGMPMLDIKSLTMQHAVNAFLETNKIDARAAVMLRQLPPNLQERVITDGTVAGTNPSAVLTSRIRKVLTHAQQQQRELQELQNAQTQQVTENVGDAGASADKISEAPTCNRPSRSASATPPLTTLRRCRCARCRQLHSAWCLLRARCRASTPRPYSWRVSARS
eukprot:NODE_13499_length_1162_cov_2.144928.p2 GENE.NODE_13499_length_1162_cov_2.144928~~NODE_13499_length_1162_cov_2.144928.p2  ORF type:complete len:178 (+),score=44.86 NODE_13499_length_1162_cov_2.144928:2-535(+)